MISKEEKVMIRLECLKLACAKASQFGDSFIIARKFESFILEAGEEESAPEGSSKTHSNKKSGNAAILS